MSEIWTFKYEPKKLDDMVLNPEIRFKLEKAIKELPNMFIYGPPGIGKGTFAHIFLKETDNEDNCMWVNASDNTGIDHVRERIKPFATAAALKIPKILILNEADALSSAMSGAQKMLRQLMEDTQKICRFIYLANYEQYFIPELKSRCQVILFEKPPMTEMVRFAGKILLSENVKFEKQILIDLCKRCYPDIRKMVWALQENTSDGELVDSKIYSTESIYKEILSAMLKKNSEEVRRLLKENWILYEPLYEYLYENAGMFSSPGGAILKIGDHLKWHKSVLNPEIHFMHMMMEMIWEKVIE